MLRSRQHARPLLKTSNNKLTVLHDVYTLQPVVQAVVQPVGWTMQMSSAKRRLSGPARTLMTSLGWRAQQGGCVDSSLDHVARLIELKKEFLFIYLFSLGCIWAWGMTKIRSIKKLYKTLLCSIYLSIIWIFKTFDPAVCTIACRV